MVVVVDGSLLDVSFCINYSFGIGEGGFGPMAYVFLDFLNLLFFISFIFCSSTIFLLKVFIRHVCILLICTIVLYYFVTMLLYYHITSLTYFYI